MVNECSIPRILHSPPVAILVVAVLYTVLAQMGYLVASLPGHISPIFPSAGLALAAVLILGRPALFGIWLGSFAANTISTFYGSTPSPQTVGAELLTNSVVGLGAMAGAGMGAFLSRRFSGDRYPLHSAPSVLAFVTIVAAGGCIISPALGVLMLSLAGSIPWDAFGYSWFTWWIGDTAGVIIVAPLLLSWYHERPFRRSPGRLLEAAGLGGATLLLCFLVFLQHVPFEYGLMLLLLWAAFRFGMRGTSTVATAIAICATVATSHASGPFARSTVNESLLFLDSFMGVTVICALFLAGMLAERKRAEESNIQLATAIEQTAETIVITDTLGMIVYVNPAFEKTSGYTRAEAFGQNPRVLKSGKHDAQFYRQMWDVLSRGEVWHGHIINRRKDGTLYEEEVSISPLRGSTGTIINYVAVKRDVTHEVQLESQLRQSQKMEAIGQLAGGVAHDFNNIITAMLMNLELLQENSNLDQETREALKELEVQADRAASLTRQLLMFSRRSVLEIQVLDLNEVVANLLKMLGRLLGEHITLAFERSDNLPCVEADAGMLEQVLMNLAVNARDAMLQGGRIAFATGAIDIDSKPPAGQPERRAGRYVYLSVSDNGCGMTESTLKHIFEPFFTTKERGKGTGLGLATVHWIVAKHQGWVEVESEVGRGTRFKVFLPATHKGAARPAQPEKLAFIQGHETILLVEDEEGVRKMVGRVLQKQGYHVLEASNGREAIAVWQRHAGQIDLLFSDMVMPQGLTGWDLLEKLQKDKPGMRIILSSGYHAEMNVRGSSLTGNIVYLQKPYKVDALLKTVRACLDRR
jgi:PAS domain S-box-containing protein